jgi:fumarylpyruvate hydrolase
VHNGDIARGIDLTRRDLQIASRKKERPWEVGKSFDYSAPCSAIQPASKIGHPSKGKIWLTVNGTEQQKGDLTELIWSVPEIIWQLSQQVALAAGDIIMTGTPAGVSALSPGDKIECGVDGVGTRKGHDRQACGLSGAQHQNTEIEVPTPRFGAFFASGFASFSVELLRNS